MNSLFSFIPVVIFFGLYKWHGDIKLATAALMIATVIQLAIAWWHSRTLKPIHIVTLVVVLGFGSATLFLDERFIVWKPTALNAVLALAFLLSPLFGKRQPLVQMLMGKEITLPDAAWQRLNLAWVTFFLALALINPLVYSLYGMEVWVDFKLFGIIGLTLLFVLAQGIWLARRGAVEGKQRDKHQR